MTLNRWLTGFWRLAWLNILWLAVTVLGLGVLGAGPASYALAKYLDRWFRHGETPPAASTFFRYARELRWHPVLMGLILQAAGAVILGRLPASPTGTCGPRTSWRSPCSGSSPCTCSS